MAPNTNFKAVALFGCSAKDLELIGPSRNASKHVQAPMHVVPSQQQVQGLKDDAARSANASVTETAVATTVANPNTAQVDSDSYWEDPADSDTLWHYHSVTAERMDARRDALARVLERMQQRKEFEAQQTKAASAANEFGAPVLVAHLKQDAARRELEVQQKEEAILQESGAPEPQYWDEVPSSETLLPGKGRVAVPQATSDIYWAEASCYADDEDEKEMSAERMQQRHTAIVRVQEQVRLQSRLPEFISEHKKETVCASGQDLFSACHMVAQMKRNIRYVPEGMAVNGNGHWDW